MQRRPPQDLFRRPDGASAVSSCREGARATISLAGEFDLSTTGVLAAEVRALLKAGDLEGVDLDAGQLRFIDSTGLRSLLAMQAAFIALGIDFRVTGASTSFTRLLDLAGLTELMLDGLRTRRASGGCPGSWRTGP